MGPAGAACLGVAIGLGFAVAASAPALDRAARAQSSGSMLEPPRDQRPTARDRSRYLLRRNADGGYSYDGVETRARIAPDGTVTFSRRPPVDVLPDTGAGSGARPSLPGRDPITSGGAGAATGDQVLVVEARPGVRFDITDEYMRIFGDDPARSEKAAFLAATADLRNDMARQARQDAARAALEQLPARLDQFWRDPRFTPVERRHLLLAMWQELGDGPSADAARAVIRDFAQRRLSPSEAAAFQQR